MITVNTDQNRRTMLIKLTNVTNGELDAGKVVLFQNDYTPTPDATIDDIVEATYTGYAAGTIGTWVGPAQDQGGEVTAVAPSVTFLTDVSLTVSNTIYGFCLTNSDKSLVFVISRFAVPVSMNEPLEMITIQPLLTYGR